MKDEKELWLNENELLNLLEGKMTWEQIHGKPENGPLAKEDLGGAKRNSAYETRGNRRGGSLGFQLMPQSPNGSSPMVSKEEKESRYMTSYQKPQTPQILPGPANETEWLDPQNPHLRTVDANEQNVFFFQRPTSSVQEPFADHSGERAATSLTFRRNTPVNAAPAISAARALAVTPVSGYKHNALEQRKSERNTVPERSVGSSLLFNDDLKKNSFFDTDSRETEQAGTQFYDADFAGGFFQNNEPEPKSVQKGFFEADQYSGSREFFASEVPAGNESFFEKSYESSFFDSSNTSEYLQQKQAQGTDALMDSDVPFVSMFSDVADFRRAPVVKIGSHEPAQKQPLALPSGYAKTKALAEGGSANMPQTGWENSQSDNQVGNQLGDKEKWNISTDNRGLGITGATLSGAGLAAQASPNSLTGIGFAGKPLMGLSNVNETVKAERKNNRLQTDSESLKSYYQGSGNDIPNVSFDQLNWSKPSAPYPAPDQYSSMEQFPGDPYTADPYAAAGEFSASIPDEANPFYREHQNPVSNQFASSQFSDDISQYKSASNKSVANQHAANADQYDSAENPLDFTINQYAPAADLDYSPNQFEAPPIDYEDSLVNRIRRERFSLTDEENDKDFNASGNSYEKYNRAPSFDEEDKIEQLYRSKRSKEFNQPDTYDMLAGFNQFEPDNDNDNNQMSRFENPGRFENRDRFQEFNSYDTLSNKSEDTRNSIWVREDERSQNIAGAAKHNQFSFHEQSYETTNDRYSDHNDRYNARNDGYNAHNDRYNAHNDGYNEHSVNKPDFALNYSYEQEDYYGNGYNSYKEEDAVDRYFSSDRRAMRSSQREARQEMVNLESQYDDYSDYSEDTEKKPFGVFKIIIILLVLLVVGIGGFLAFQLFF